MEQMVKLNEMVKTSLQALLREENKMDMGEMNQTS